MLFINRARRLQMPFKFLNFQIEHTNFKEVVRRNQGTNFTKYPFLDFNRKIKQVKKDPTLCSRQGYGAILQKLLIREERAKSKEKLSKDHLSQENRVVMQRAKDKYTRDLQFEESFLQQNASYDWFERGERNARFCHSFVNERRNMLKVIRIVNDKGYWLEEEDQIANKSISFYLKQFTKERDAIDFCLLDHILRWPQKKIMIIQGESLMKKRLKRFSWF